MKIEQLEEMRREALSQAAQATAKGDESGAKVHKNRAHGLGLKIQGRKAIRDRPKT
jgi:hypothetical protein